MQTPVLKYLSVKALLQARMVRDMTPGDQLPSETQLQTDFAVSRATVQQALQLLEREGWIERKQGKGTFYRGQPLSQTEQQPSELLEQLLGNGTGATVKVLNKGLQLPSHRVAQQLQTDPEDMVVYFERLGLVDGEPLLFVYTYLPQEYGVHFLNDPQAGEQLSFAAQLQDRHGVQVHEVQQTISAGLADPLFADTLGLEIGAPVLEGLRVYLTEEGKPILYSRAFYRADRHKFVVRVNDWRK